MLQIRNLTKIYRGGHKAVDGLTLSIEAGDIYGFIGHNGAGKTTTLRAVAGSLQFDSGEILINGTSIVEDPVACKRQMAFIPDNPDIYEFMTGIQYLNFIGDIYGVGESEREERLRRYGDAFEITSVFGDLIGSYSHGMKQKLVVIAALLHDPKLMVLDEPFVGLDPKAAHTLKQIMREQCDKGASIFFSTHVLDVAEKLCNKIAIIRDGKLAVSGTMEEVKGDRSLEEEFMELIER
ncbi:MAG: ABC transporter ATP-binding protein [Bacillota bacterium]